MSREFPVVMRGYSRREVDELFNRIDAALGQGTAIAPPVTLDELRSLGLSVQMRGYGRAEVDQAISAAMKELEARDR